MQKFNEEQLVILAQDALPYDASFYQRLVKPYVTQLRGYCARLLNDQHEGEDAAQEVLIKILLNLKSFEWQQSFRSWMYKIAHNECIDRIRKNSRVSFDDEFNLEDIHIESKPQDMQHLLASIMEQLSWLDRNIMLLRYRSGLEFSEIAQIVGLKLSAVKMRHTRVLDFLNQRISSSH
ncbi:sigma-70 family RNA polymerase sigma factor [Pseudoalteromonas ulvae]|uniref:RNA polymerase subunit sigma n=1 Tax=Pseudoalteromonas ulvae TaxID=107327 RepID=A0A2C9ZZB5_PSEDV|nr:sigma-70 family RNA polymerase sigma factor [Pseudoalteromonas ulvae]OUL56111.1 RNA polymerase subunit sigma [Pseudoalteromonas ulvae]